MIPQHLLKNFDQFATYPHLKTEPITQVLPKLSILLALFEPFMAT